MSEEDRRAEEAKRSVESMKPQTSSPASGQPPAATPLSEDDRKAAESRRKLEQMKPQ
jgi:hypothetical protein